MQVYLLITITMQEPCSYCETNCTPDPLKSDYISFWLKSHKITSLHSLRSHEKIM